MNWIKELKEMEAERKKARSYAQLAKTIEGGYQYFKIMGQWNTNPPDLSDAYREPFLHKVTEDVLDWLELTDKKYKVVFAIIDDAITYQDSLPVLAKLRKLSRRADLEWIVEFVQLKQIKIYTWETQISQVFFQLLDPPSDNSKISGILL